jgi:uncharacterized membrane protein YdjX (TVP38/TMEM64 family)
MVIERRASGESCLRSRLRRFAPVALVLLAMVAVFASGAHRHLSLETLVRHRMAIDAYIEAHAVTAIAAYMAIYISVVALSIPGAVFLTIAGGVLFGTAVGGLATVVSATTGATIVFLVAKTTCGEALVRRAGPLAAKIADGFCGNAFRYLLFLRLVPVPFFLVNLVPALVGVKLSTFVIATFIGIIPATFAFSFLGASVDSVITAQEKIPQLIAAIAAIAVIAFIPLAIKQWRGRYTHAERLH